MKKRLNNKGFSLVELIIVIAIMAALVAILAPQYLKYVEKSRVAGDENTVSEMVNALKTATVDETYSAGIATLLKPESYMITLTKNNAPAGITANDQVDKALTEYFGSNYKDVRLKSAKYTDGTTYNEIVITISSTPSGNDTVVNVSWAGGKT